MSAIRDLMQTLELILANQARLGRNLNFMFRALSKGQTMAQADIDRLKTAATKNSDAVASATGLLQSLAQLIRDNADDPVELQAIATQIEGSAQALADAVVAGTPAAPA